MCVCVCVCVCVREREREKERCGGQRDVERYQCDNRYLWISDPSKSGILSTRRSELKI